MCRKNCTFFGFNGKLMRCRTHKKIFTSEMSEEADWKYYLHNLLPIDCKDFRENGHTNSGVYEIYPYETSSRPVRVYCDMETMDGGWTAIQKRVKGSLRFDRNWTEYKNGFGSPEQDVWIGNNEIHQLTKRKDCSLYVSITLVNGTSLYQLYDGFTVSDESENYKLSLKGTTRGTLGDSIRNTHIPGLNVSGMYFSTSDRDNDRLGGDSCAVYNGGGWWFNACHQAFLNGPWASPYWIYVWDPIIMDGTEVMGTLMLIKRH
ncbi:fibroleukin-like [Saccostrea echinata]|uniref:fibroleukin-like n=1 Tax=Saccostrea echinata TaxID=191078 RepID=UPI002A7EC3F9|nr:fibroleukin-like [Saccostrea echinata]